MRKYTHTLSMGLCLLFMCTEPSTAWQPPDDLELLPVLDQTPCAFTRADGQPVQSQMDWQARRQEMKAMLQYYAYGHMPPRPDTLYIEDYRQRPPTDSGVVHEFMTLVMGSQSPLRMRIGLSIPPGPGPFPALIKEEPTGGFGAGSTAILERDIISVRYTRNDLDPDIEGVDTVGVAQAAYPDYDWSTLAVWAWGAMRTVDYLQTRPEIDPERIGVVGHSRGGKAVLLAGAFDERISLVAANGSGAGGAGSFRIQPSGVETLRLITDPARFAYWFHPRLRWFAGREQRLPFDQHFLKALIAPRAFIATDALGDQWANPIGTAATSVAADPVFRWLGAADANALHFRSGGHDLTLSDWRALLDFAQWHWRGTVPDRPQRFWQPTAAGQVTEGDVNGDGLLDLEDFFALADAWQQPALTEITADAAAWSTARPPRDLNDDGRMDEQDLDRLSRLFSARPAPVFIDCVPAYAGSLSIEAHRTDADVRVYINGDGRPLNGYAAEISYDPSAYRLTSVEPTLGAVAPAQTLSWHMLAPGRVVAVKAIHRGGLVDRGPLLELAFQPLAASNRAPFRLERAQVRAQTTSTAQSGQPSIALQGVIHMDSAEARAVPTAVLEHTERAQATEVGLSHSWPNPFNGSTRMRYHTRTAQRVQLTVYDLLGRPVCNLFEGNSPSGVHELTWDGRDGAGRPVAAGVYWVYMATATNRLSQKIVLLK